MRSVTFLGTAMALVTAMLLLANPASADRFCRKACEGGVCRTHCVERGERMYMYSHREHWREHERARPGVGIHGPGVDVDVGH